MADAGAGTESSSGALDTFPKLLRRNARERPERFALREKEFGIWQSWTWRDLETEVRELACGLAELGFGRGDRLAIIGDNRPRLYAAMCAAQSLGGIPVPMYQDSVAKELGYVMEHAEARASQSPKTRSRSTSCSSFAIPVPSSRESSTWTRAACATTTCPSSSPTRRCWLKGRERHRRDSVFWDAEVDNGQGRDACIILYTSGTTGNPKGVVLLFDNVVVMAERGAEFEGLGPDDEVLAYLPMAWVGDHIFSFAQSYIVGFCVRLPGEWRHGARRPARDRADLLLTPRREFSRICLPP